MDLAWTFGGLVIAKPPLPCHPQSLFRTRHIQLTFIHTGYIFRRPTEGVTVGNGVFQEYELGPAYVSFSDAKQSTDLAFLDLASRSPTLPSFHDDLNTAYILYTTRSSLFVFATGAPRLGYIRFLGSTT